MEAAIQAMQFVVLATDEELMKAEEAMRDVEIVMPEVDDDDDDVMTMSEMRGNREGGLLMVFDEIMKMAGKGGITLRK